MKVVASPKNLKIGCKILIDCIPSKSIQEVTILDIGLSLEDSFSKSLFSFRYKYKNLYYWQDSNCIIEDFYKHIELIETKTFDNVIGDFYGDKLYEKCITYRGRVYKVFKGSYIKTIDRGLLFVRFK